MWTLHRSDECHELSRLQGELGFTLSPGVHLITRRHFEKRQLHPIYTVLVFLAPNHPFLPPNPITFRRIRESIFNDALTPQQQFVGPVSALCNYCLLPAESKCSHCELAYYCNAKCQELHLKIHENLCYGQQATAPLFFSFPVCPI